MKIFDARIIYCYVILFFVSNCLTQTLLFFDDIVFNRYTAIVNLTFELYLIFTIVIQPKLWCKLKSIFILIGCFLLGQYTLNGNVSFIYDFQEYMPKGRMYILNGFLFFLLFYEVFECFENKKEIARQSFKIIFFIISINTLFILGGFFFNINNFQSYRGSERFGYLGLLGHNTFMFYMYSLLILFLYYLRCISLGNTIFFWFTIFTSFLIGKKGIFLFLFFLIIYHVYTKHVLYKSLVSTILISLIILLVFINEQILNLLSFIFPFWKQYVEKWDFITIVFSGRNLNFLKWKHFVFENWTIINYFFGGANFPENWIELSLFDVFSFFGLIGVLTCFLFLRKILKNHSLKNQYLICIPILLSFFCGNFFVNTFQMVSFVFFINFLKSEVLLPTYKE